MSNIRFYNARILDVENGSIFEGELHVEGNTISYIGTDVTSKEFDEEIDCHGNLLMPGFKNAHTHSAMTFLRSYCDDASLQTWLFDNVLPMESKLTENDVYELTKLAVLEYLSSGITTVMDMYIHPFAGAKAFTEMNFRNVLIGCLDYYSISKDDMRKMYHDMNSISSLTKYRLGFHSEYTIEENMLRNIASLSKELKEPIFTHLSETKSEVEGSISRHGMTPIQYFDSLGLLENGGGFYHCVHLTKEDVELFKEKKLNVVTCPCSNSKLTSGIPDLLDYYNNEIKIGIGTDGAASNNSLDMFKEMYLLSVLQKLKHNDPVAIKANEIIKFATYNNAHIMGMEEIDSLKVGKLADIIMIDLNKPSMQPINNIVSNLVYSGSKDIVKMTMIDGNILYFNGEYRLNVNVDDIYKKSQNIIDRIKNS